MEISNKIAVMDLPASAHVPETRFGIWFLGTETWVNYVLEPAVTDLQRLIVDAKPSYPVVVDVGCGWGRSFEFLQKRFAPERLIGIDVNPRMLDISAARTREKGVDVEFIHGSCCSLPLPDQSADILFCHQTFHHLVNQESAAKEFFRVLRPGGLLLFAESTKAYIHSWLIRYLFRHPMDVQKTAEEYVELIRGMGFNIVDSAISLPYLWWSRPDLGFFENVLGRKPPAGREETLVNFVAVRP